VSRDDEVQSAQGIKRGSSKAVLLASLGLVALGSLGFVVGDSLGAYFVRRLVMGLGSGGVWIGITFGTLERWRGCEYLCMSRTFGAYAVGPDRTGTWRDRGDLCSVRRVSPPIGCHGVPMVMAEPTTRRVFGSDLQALRLPGFLLSSATVLLVVLAIGTMDGVLPLHFATRLTQTEIGFVRGRVSVGGGECGDVGTSPASSARPKASALITSDIAMAALSMSCRYGSDALVPGSPPGHRLAPGRRPRTPELYRPSFDVELLPFALERRDAES
jgi:hypothetical protein